MNGFSSESVNVVEILKKRKDALNAQKNAECAPKRVPRFITGSPSPIVRSGKKIGLNDPCPCGSGVKFKKCCWRKEK
jgi:preprotein translocase subunit SecA